MAHDEVQLRPANRGVGVMEVVVKIGWVLLVMACLIPLRLSAQRSRKKLIYLGGMGGFATLSGDGSAMITPASASTSLFDPQNGAVGEFSAGVHLFPYVSFEGDYIWNRNPVTLVSTTESGGTTSYYRRPENVTQNTFLANVLIYFRRRGDRIRPYLSEGFGGVLIHNSFTGTATVVGSPTLPPANSDHASLALRTLVGMDVRMRNRWYLRYTFGETIDRNTYGDSIFPQEHRIPKNFQNLFGMYFEF
jgi:Outer membrane protein beta-barrel domain